MKRFIYEIVILFSTTLIFGEIICRILPIVPDIPIKTNKDGYYMLKENQSGNYIRGKFPKWLSSKYEINNEGFVSSEDYFFQENNGSKIAIVGDSFVEGFQVDSDKSIGRLIEKSLKDYKVYEFGYSGYNFHNYIELYEEFGLDRFKNVFIIIDNEDLLSEKADKIKYTKSIRIKEVFFRKIYDNFYFIKYLNWNHGIFNKLLGMFNGLKLKVNKKKSNSLRYTDIVPFLNKNKNISLILKSSKDSILKNIYPNVTFFEINHQRNPYDFGYDQHWNLNGKYNVADNITKWLNQQKK